MKPEDTNNVWLQGAVARGPVFEGGSWSFTCAGHVHLASGKVLPWFHRVVLPDGFDTVLTPGVPVSVRGRLDHRKQLLEGEVRSTVDVMAASVRLLDAALHPVVEASERSFILVGGLNRVRLAGNLTRAAAPQVLLNGDPFVRLNLAVESGGRSQFFIVKAAREQASSLQALGKGARLGLQGALLSETYPGKDGRPVYGVSVEVIAARVS